MMTRVEMGQEVFLHASDIQLLNDTTIDLILAWQPDIVLAAGPPLYLDRLAQKETERARNNALRFGEVVPMLILDNHLMRSSAGLEWLDTLSEELGKQLYCVADFMHQPRCLLEADRIQLYESMPVLESTGMKILSQAKLIRKYTGNRRSLKVGILCNELHFCRA